MAGFIEMAKRSGQGAMQKIKESSDIVKNNLLIQEEEEKKKSLFQNLGQAYYEQAINDEMKVEESLEDFVLEISEADKRIEQYREEIKKLKNVRICPECHSEYSDDSVFCSKCGTRLKQEDEEAEAGKKCAKCDAELGEEDAFCFNCGSKIE